MSTFINIDIFFYLPSPACSLNRVGAGLILGLFHKILYF
jgi:hypothetical protein